MTNKQAIHCIKVECEEAVCEECELYGTVGTDHCFEDACRKAVEALEKQIPKEPYRISDIDINDNAIVQCPICKAGNDTSIKTIKQIHCWKCGQAIKWN